MRFGIWYAEGMGSRMWKAIKKAYNAYRHGKAIRDLLVFVGVWKRLVYGASAGVGILMAWVTHLPLWGRILLALATTAGCLFIAGFGVALYRFLNRRS